MSNDWTVLAQGKNWLMERGPHHGFAGFEHRLTIDGCVVREETVWTSTALEHWLPTHGVNWSRLSKKELAASTASDDHRDDAPPVHFTASPREIQKPYTETMRVYEVGNVNGFSLVTLRAEKDGASVWELTLSMPPELAPMKGALVEVVPPMLRVQVVVQ